jgi:hypothetical protein
MRSIQTILAVVASFSVSLVTAQFPLMLRQDSASVLAAAEAAYPTCAVCVSNLSFEQMLIIFVAKMYGRSYSCFHMFCNGYYMSLFEHCSAG